LLSTLDTNIIVYTALDCPVDEKYATEFREQGSRFLTRTVYDEANRIEERITQFQILIESGREGGEKPSETFSRIEDSVDADIKTKLNRYFNNILEYYDEKFEQGYNLQEITDSIIYDLTNFTSMDDRIRPSSKIMRDSEDDRIEYESIIENNDLVDREDKDIIIQMKVYQDISDLDLCLITRDSGFHPEKEAWKNNFPRISVKDISDEVES